MQVFRKYLNDKLDNPEFKNYYRKNCAICPITVQIVSAVNESPISPEEIASLCDIPAKIIRDLESAEKCCVASVEKLCDYFGIPRPSDCLQLKPVDGEK